MSEDALRLTALFDLKILDTPPEPRFDDIVFLATKACQAPVALISLVASDRQWFKARSGFDPTETPLDQSVCFHTLSVDEMLVIPDLTRDERTKTNSLVTAAPHLRFYAGAVLKSDGVAIGSLCVIDHVPRPEGLSPDQAESLLALARQTMALMAMRREAMWRSEAMVDMRRAGLASLDRALVSEATATRLRETEARSRAAQEAGRVGAFELDVTAGRLFVTPEFCRLYGIPTAEEIDAADIDRLVVASDRTAASSPESRRDGTATLDSDYRIRRAYDGALRWISRRSAFEFDAAGNAVRWLGVVQDVTYQKAIAARKMALAALGDALRDVDAVPDAVMIAAKALGEMLGATRAGYAVVDRAAGFVVIERDWAGSDRLGIEGTYPLASFERTVERLAAGTALAVANIPAATWLEPDAPGYIAVGARSMICVPLGRRGDLPSFLYVHSVKPRTWTADEIDFAETVGDRTYAAIAKLQAEAQQRLLNEELSHRLKNTFAMVQAIASQTLRGASDKVAVRAFEERIIAMSNAHDLLLQERWSAAPIRGVVEGVLNLHGCSDRVTVSGPDLKLGSKATLSSSMLLHELATNAIKYGALSTDKGHVELSWRTELTGAEPSLVVSWVERGGPPVKPPSNRRGFGSRLIGMGLAGAGHADMDYAPAGLVARFRAPLSVVSEA